MIGSGPRSLLHQNDVADRSRSRISCVAVRSGLSRSVFDSASEKPAGQRTSSFQRCRQCARIDLRVCIRGCFLGPDLQPRATAAPKSPQQLYLRRIFKRRRLRLRTRSTSPNRSTHGSAFDEDLRHPREKECRPPRHGVMVPSYPQRQASTIHCRLIRVHAECLGGARRSRLNALGKRPPGPPVSSRTRVE